MASSLSAIRNLSSGIKIEGLSLSFNDGRQHNGRTEMEAGDSAVVGWRRRARGQSGGDPTGQSSQIFIFFLNGLPD